MGIDVDSDNLLIRGGSYLVNLFKSAFLFALRPILNYGGPKIANLAVGIMQDTMRGNVDGGII